MNRLLSTKEMDRVLTQAASPEISGFILHNFQNEADAIAKAQDPKNLKAVGRWLQDQVVRGFITAYPNDIREIVNTFLRGEMPGEVIKL